jgi:dTDP-4-dehydrorhamnose 3,5-epimerase
VIFTETPLAGAFVLDLEKRGDDRGFFARTFCQHEFTDHGLEPVVAQCNLSWNARAGTLRGMHYQLPPAAETKLVRCTSGAIYDVIVDLREDSPTYLQHFGVELTAENRRALYIPPGCAHGFQTLIDDSEVLYLMTEFYVPELARGVRWNDPVFGVEWPIADPTISERDATYPDFRP